MSPVLNRMKLDRGSIDRSLNMLKNALKEEQNNKFDFTDSQNQYNN